MPLGKDKGLKAGGDSPLAVLGSVRGIILFLFILSGVVNILALTGAVYMLQIYDRALTSQSVPTLLALSFLAIGLYLFQGVLDVTRSQILVRLGAKFDDALSPLTHKVTIDMPRFGFSLAESKDRSRDVDTVRQFMSGQGPQALFDLPWMPLYLVFIYVLHPWLGTLTIIGALVLALLTLITEVVTRRHAKEVNQSEVMRANVADAHTNNSDVLRAMGITGRAVKRFQEVNSKHLQIHTKLNDLSGTLSGLAKIFRLMLQSAVLGLGAYLTIQGELTAGAIIAASVASARALAPVDLAINHWKSLVIARRSYARLGETLAAMDNDNDMVDLPKPVNGIQIENITVAAPGSGSVVLSDFSVNLKSGQALGLVGATGGGKSTFARAVTGVWPLVRGSVRFDNADIKQWRPEDLGKHIGYLPQEISLLDGTIADNISRLDPEPNSEKIIAAAHAAGVHELIVRLPNGYQTELGPHGSALSGGQRQRIGLARALYDDPFLVVLDEPNSNLDMEGDQALTGAIQGIKNRGGVAIIIAHRPSAISACDFVGIVKQGLLVALGPKDEILEDLTRQNVKSVPVSEQKQTG